MSRAKYADRKDSGVAWLGEVPAHWNIERLKFSSTSRVSNVDKVSADDELPVRLCNYVDVYKNDQIHSDLPFMEGTATAEEIAKFGLRIGDVIITKDSEDWRDIAIPAFVRETAPDLVCGYHLAIVRADRRRLLPRFLFDLFRSRAVNTQFQVAASGVTRYGLPKAAVGDAIVPIPPPNEQAQIAAFLDQETAKIDDLIAKKRELIERLKEKRTALISHVVTKGLPPEEAAKHGFPVNPPLKPSGVPWLGDIPEHWKVVKATRGFRVIGSGTTPKADNPDFYGGDIPWVTTSELRETLITETKQAVTEQALEEHSALKLYPVGTTLIAMYGATIGRLGTLGIQATVNQACCAYAHGLKLTPRFMYYWLWMRRPILISLSVGGGQPNLSQDDLKQLWVPAPEIEEQDRITEFLDRQVGQLQRVMDAQESAIEKLQEYRSALITAAVTGKIDVRQEATS
ncbi:MAG: restriction endonuclease subunit S [Fimbriimonadaceae bacterium]|nr:restriction endonuclease subunit S [Fimbriimonadaceae bacterium]